MGDREPRVARHIDRCWFLQPFGHCKRQETMLCGQECYERGSGRRVGKGVGWHWVVRRWWILEPILFQCTEETYVLLDLAGVSHQKAATPAVIEGIKHPERHVNARKHHYYHPCCSCSPPNPAKRRPTMQTLKVRMIISHRLAAIR